MNAVEFRICISPFYLPFRDWEGHIAGRSVKVWYVGIVRSSSGVRPQEN